MFALATSIEKTTFELASHPLVLGVGATAATVIKGDYSVGWDLDFVSPGSVTTDIGGYSGYAKRLQLQFGGRARRAR